MNKKNQFEGIGVPTFPIHPEKFNKKVMIFFTAFKKRYVSIYVKHLFTSVRKNFFFEIENYFHNFRVQKMAVSVPG